MPLSALTPTIHHAKTSIDFLELVHKAFFDNTNEYPTPSGGIPTKLTASGNDISAVIFGIEVTATKRFVRYAVPTGKEEYFLEYTFHANHQDAKVKIWQFYLNNKSEIIENIGSTALCDCVSGTTTTNTICCFLVYALLLSPVFAPA